MFASSTFHSVPKIIFGCGSINDLGQQAKNLGASKVALFTDKGITGKNIHLPAMESLHKAGLKPAVYQDVEPDPPLDGVAPCVDFIKSHQADLVVGLGGGSVLDMAKIAAIMSVNEGPISKYVGVNLVPQRGLPTLLVPTTAGTGAEATSISVLTDHVRQVKVGIVSDYMYASLTLLDPELTVGLPQGLTASTGLDAFIHAFESYIGKRATPITESLCLTSMELISHNLRLAYAQGENLEARSAMLMGSLTAGMGFGNTQSGAVHALAHVLGAKYHIAHGASTSLMLPEVMRFNSIAAPEKFARVARVLGEETAGLSRMEQAQAAIRGARRLIEDVGFQLGLKHYGVEESSFDEMASESLDAARLWGNNPRSATSEQVRAIFQAAF